MWNQCAERRRERTRVTFTKCTPRQAFIALHLTRGTSQMKVPLLPFFFATAVLLSVLLLGRFLLLHEHLGSNSRETHDKVASSLHKLLRSQHKLEDRLEKLLRSVEAMQRHERQMEDTEMAQEVTGEIEEAAPTKHSDTAGSWSSIILSKNAGKKRFSLFSPTNFDETITIR